MGCRIDNSFKIFKMKIKILSKNYFTFDKQCKNYSNLRMKINMYQFCCLARTKKNDKYFIDRFSADELNTQMARDAEHIIYSEYTRKSGISVITIISYLIGLIYWYLVPD